MASYHCCVWIGHRSHGSASRLPNGPAPNLFLDGSRWIASTSLRQSSSPLQNSTRHNNIDRCSCRSVFSVHEHRRDGGSYKRRNTVRVSAGEYRHHCAALQRSRTKTTIQSAAGCVAYSIAGSHLVPVSDVLL